MKNKGLFAQISPLRSGLDFAIQRRYLTLEYFVMVVARLLAYTTEMYRV